MEFFNENSEIIIAALLLIAFVVLIVILIINSRIYKSLGSNKFSLNDFNEKDLEDSEEYFSLTAANRSLNDVTISAIGLCYGSKYFDFKQNYKAQNNISEQNKIVIMQRTFIKLKLDKEQIKDAIFKSTFKRRVGIIRIYVIDSFGNVFKARAKTVTKVLAAAYKKLLAQKAAEQKSLKAKEKLERKTEFIENMNVKKIKGEKLSLIERVKMLLCGGKLS